MRWGVFVFLVLFASFVSAEIIDVDLSRWESFEFQGKNITILNLNEDDDKAIICVNNVKTIVSDEKEKNIEHVSIDLRHVNNGVASLRLDGTCRKCECDENCANELCGISSDSQTTEVEEKSENGEVVEEKEQHISLTGEHIEESDFMLLTSFLIIVVVILGIIVFIKKSVF